MYIIRAGKNEKVQVPVVGHKKRRYQWTTRLRSAHLVNDIFEVRDVARHASGKGPDYFLATLANHAKQYDAIAGPPAAKLTVGDMVHVHGCFLLRRGEPVLVVCSLKPINQPGQDKSEGSQWKRERRYSTIPLSRRMKSLRF